MWQTYLSVVLLLVALVFVIAAKGDQKEELRDVVRREGLEDEYDLELRRLLEIESFRPKGLIGRDPRYEALEIVRLQKRVTAKNLSSEQKSQPANITNVAVNYGTVLGDLNASVHILQTLGNPQIADSIERLTTAISESSEIRDSERKDLLENLALISKEAVCPKDQRRPGLLKSSLGFITASLATAKDLIPLADELHKHLKLMGIIDW